MSPRSNGVMKVRRTAISTSRVIVVGVVLAVHDDLVVARRSPSPPSSMARSASAPATHRRGMSREQVEEALFLRHQGLKPAQHGDLRRRRIGRGGAKARLVGAGVEGTAGRPSATARGHHPEGAGRPVAACRVSGNLRPVEIDVRVAIDTPNAARCFEHRRASRRADRNGT